AGAAHGGHCGSGGLTPPGHRIDSVYLHREPVDCGKQINGPSAIGDQELGRSPSAAALFVVVTRPPTSIKARDWQRNGFCLWQKRLERQRFAWPDDEAIGATCRVSMRELEWLLEGFDLWHNKPHKALNFMATC